MCRSFNEYVRTRRIGSSNHLPDSKIVVRITNEDVAGTDSPFITMVSGKRERGGIGGRGREVRPKAGRENNP